MTETAEHVIVRFRWDEAEPPVPAGLRELSDSLASVAHFLKIDDDLIAVAAKASAPLVSVSDDGIADWVTVRSPRPDPR